MSDNVIACGSFLFPFLQNQTRLTLQDDAAVPVMWLSCYLTAKLHRSKYNIKESNKCIS